MEDLTIIFLTLNKVPKLWSQYHKKVLLEAVQESPIITISRQRLDWGWKNLIQSEEPSVNNIYKQILRASKIATTDYIAIAEDDNLYHKSHFEYRPPKETFGFNGHRWGVFTWGKPFYYHKNRISNATMIAPRELVVKSLTERFKLYPNNQIGELGKEKGTRLNRYNIKMFYSDVGVIYFSHKNGLDGTERRRTKKPSPIQAYDIKYWGKIEKLRKEWK